MPPGSLVPAEWVLAELEQGGEAPDSAESPSTTSEDFTVAEIAEKAKRKPGTVRDWIRTGKLRAYTFRGRDYRITPAAWEEFKEAERNGGGNSTNVETPRGKADLGSWRKVRRLKQAI